VKVTSKISQKQIPISRERQLQVNKDGAICYYEQHFNSYTALENGKQKGGEKMKGKNIMRNKIFLYSFVVLIYFLSGCATIPTVPPLDTPSGKPEVIISNATKKEIINAIINYMLNLKYQIHSQSDHLIVFSQRIKSFAAGLIYGSRYDPTPESRISFTLVENNSNIRVIGTAEIITNPGSAFERRNINPNQNELQDLLYSIKWIMDTREKGKIGVNIDKNGIIVSLKDDGPAFKSGLKVGDKIIKIDGEIVQWESIDNIYSVFSKIIGAPGTIVELTIIRDGKELVFKVERQISK
jgi:membrane-associated protease RseP (regulator of RpoE activity)